MIFSEFIEKTKKYLKTVRILKNYVKMLIESLGQTQLVLLNIMYVIGLYQMLRNHIMIAI